MNTSIPKDILNTKNKQQIDNKQLSQIADKILIENKYAFEVLGNGKI